MGGSSTVSISSPRVNEIQVQKSAYGAPVALAYGRCRVAINLGWYADFQAIAHTEKQSGGGKGGDVSTESTTYTYYAAVIMFIGERIKNVRAVYRDKEVFADGGAYLATITGDPAAVSQLAVGMTTKLADAGNLSGDYLVVAVGPGSFQVAVPSNTPTITAESLLFGIPGGFLPIILVPGTLSYTGESSALSVLGLGLKTGEISQAVWPYLTTNHPDQAIGYSQTAYLYSPQYQLNSSAGLQNHSLEVDGALQLPGKADADPRDVMADLLTNQAYGVSGWPANLIGDLTEFSTYCRANNLLISPCYDSQRQASEVLQEIARSVNCEIVWSEGLFKVRTYGDEAATANGVIFTPDLAPLFHLTDDDFLSETEPVSCDPTAAADAFNWMQIEYLNRDHQYNAEPISAFDQADIEGNGLRKKDPVSAHLFCEASIARKALQLMLQRVVYVRRRFKFVVGWRYCMLEPMDLVTITDPGLGLNQQLVRIKQIDESADGELTITAEEVVIGAGSAFTYETQQALGWVNDQNASPGAVATPVLFNGPSGLVGGALQLWCAVAGQAAAWGGCEFWVSVSGSDYRRIGTIFGPSRFGYLASDLDAAEDPDETNTLSVDMSDSGGELDSATQDDADALTTLMWVGGELLAYRDATLTGPDSYDLTYLRRGQYDTASANHVAGDAVVRLDDSIFRYSYDRGQLGKTISVKFRSFNVYRRQTQDLADCIPYTVTLGAPPPNVSGFSVDVDGTTGTFAWDAVTALQVLTGGHVVIRFNPASSGVTWDNSAEVLRVPGAATQGQLSTYSPGTYLAKLQDINGLYSNTAAVIAGSGGGGAGGELIVTVAPISATKSGFRPQLRQNVTASVDGGTAPLSFAWSIDSAPADVFLINATSQIVTVGTDSSFDGYYASITLHCTVTDSALTPAVVDSQIVTIRFVGTSNPNSGPTP